MRLMRRNRASEAWRRIPAVLSLLLALFLVPALSSHLQAQVPVTAPPTGAAAADTAADARQQALHDGVEAILARPELSGMHWGLLLARVPRSESDPLAIAYARNSDLRHVPASNHKLVVAAAALELLGAGYRHNTAFLASRGPDAAGVIEGDLLLPGTGDPTLGPPFHDSAEAAAGALADSLVAAGVRQVEGALVVDVSSWDSTSVPTGWLVGNLPNRYAATGGAFSMGLGELEIVVTGTTPGQPARVEWAPLGTPDFVDARVTTGEVGSPTRLSDGYLPESRRWQVEGTLAPGARQTLVRAQRDPVRQSAAVLLAALEARGIEVRRGLEIRWERETPLDRGCLQGGASGCTGHVRVAGLASPPLSEVVEPMLSESQNWIAEQLVRTVGMEHGEGGSWAEGFQVIHDLMEARVGVDPRDLNFRDASGLAGYNLVTPMALGRILGWAVHRPWGPAYRAALPEPGRPSSTLQSRLLDLSGQVAAKTGTIRHVNGLSGYLVDAHGEEYLFVILSNASNSDAGPVRQAMDDLVRLFVGAPGS